MNPSELLENIRTWQTDDKVRICVGVDIGGSGHRVRISNAINKDQYIDLPHYSSQSTKEIIESFIDIQDTITKIVSSFESCGAALAVAGPIKNGTVVLTNWPGEPEARTLTLDNLPQKLFPKEKTAFLNDLDIPEFYC